MAKSEKVKRTIAECQHNLFKFAQLLNPYYCYGDVHEEVFSWLGNPESSDRQLLLLPRGHLKSHCLAVFCVWKITYNPSIALVYLVSQEDLGKAQLYAIRNMMLSDIYTQHWPEMFEEKKTYGKKKERGVWSASAFDVDHPDRRELGTRDHTMIMKTVKSNAQGLHCDGLVLDDVVVPQFADTQTGRNELSRSLGYFSSILNPGGWIKAAGTRYHPQDAYQSMIEAKRGIWDPEQGVFKDDIPLWDVMEQVVEDSYDRSGTGNFLWPRTESVDGRWYGFNPEELSKIRADYASHSGLTHFYSQYYNDPNDVGNARISRDKFQYYDPKFIEKDFPHVRYRGNKLNVFAAMDVAWSTSGKSDYTAIVVIGLDADGYIYVLDLERMRTSNFQEYYDKVAFLQSEWGFRRILVETNAGGALVAQELESFIRRNGGNLVVERRASTNRGGTKDERWAAVLEPRYESKSVFHFRGSLTTVLEDELVSSKPRHDDLKDALCAAISISKPPMASKRLTSRKLSSNSNVVVGRFGGRLKIRA